MYITEATENIGRGVKNHCILTLILLTAAAQSSNLVLSNTTKHL